MKHLNELDKELIKADEMDTAVVREIIAEMDPADMPEPNYEKIRSELFSKKPKFARTKRIAIIAVASMLVLSLMSVGVAVYYHQMVYYDMQGNKREVTDDMSYSIPKPGSEESEFELSLRENMEESEILFMIAPSSTSYYNKPIKICDYGELTAYLQNNGGEQLSFPEYIPQGYELDFAEVYVNLSGGVDYKDFEPVYYEEKFGNIYEIYKLPEDLTTVERVSLHYYKDKERIKGYILCHMNFTWSGGDKLFGSSVTGNTKSEVLDMPQFEYSLIVSSEINHAWANRDDWELKLMAEKLTDNPVSILNVSFISKTWQKSNAMNFGGSSYKFDAIDYNITSMSISRDEIIKMAESIK
jgi:hypothetical protein